MDDQGAHVQTHSDDVHFELLVVLNGRGETALGVIC